MEKKNVVHDNYINQPAKYIRQELHSTLDYPGADKPELFF
jgi:hypothetical protein